MTLQQELINDRYAKAALEVQVNGRYAKDPLSIAWKLHEADLKRFAEKGKYMSDDHLKQLAKGMA